MISWRDAFALMFLVLALPSVACADFEQCVETSYQSISTCDSASSQARARADGLAAQNAAQVSGDSLRDAAAREAQVTQQIAAIYAGARAACESAAAQCQSACTGEEADLADACKEDIGQYQSQLQNGQNTNLAGHRGSTTSKGLSSGQAAPESARAAPAAGQVAGAEAGGIDGAAGAINNDPETKSLTNILQRPVGAEENGSAGRGDGASGVESAAGAAGGTVPGSSQATGTSSSAAAGSWGRPSIASATDGSGDDDHPNRAGTGGLAPAAAGGGNLENAILAYCKGPGRNSANAECERVIAQDFCSESANKPCPTCTGKNEADLEGAGATELKEMCTLACTKDPQFAPRLGVVCRSLWGESGVAASDAETRAPASVGGNAEIGSRFGLSLFTIHSQTIHRKCQQGKLNCRG